MALKAIIDSLDGLPEDVQKEYKQQDGKYILDVTPVSGYELGNTEDLKKKIGDTNLKCEDAIKTRDAAKQKLKAFEGVDPTEVATMKTQLEKFKNIDPNLDPDKLVEERAKALMADKLADTNKKHEQALSDEKANSASLKEQVRKNLIISGAKSALAKHKGSEKLLLPTVINASLMIADEEGNFTAGIKGDNGEPKLSMEAGNNGNMTIDEYVKIMSEDEDYAPAFGGTGSTGGGGGGGGGGGQGKITRITRSQAETGQYVDAINKGEVIVVDD